MNLSFNFSSNVSAPISEGATALKLENELQEETNTEATQIGQTNNEVLGSSLTLEDSVTQETQLVVEPEV